MTRVGIGIIATLLVGLAVGIIGGVVLGEPWFHGGELVFGAGVLVLCGLSLWKRPREFLDALEGESDTGEGSLRSSAPAHIEAQFELPKQSTSPPRIK